MDELDMQHGENEGGGVDQTVIAALEELLDYARGRRAESVMVPQQPAAEAPPPGAEDAQMAELEQMLAEPPGAPPKKPEDDEETE